MIRAVYEWNIVIGHLKVFVWQWRWSDERRRSPKVRCPSDWNEDAQICISVQWPTRTTRIRNSMNACPLTMLHAWRDQVTSKQSQISRTRNDKQVNFVKTSKLARKRSKQTCRRVSHKSQLIIHRVASNWCLCLLLFDPHQNRQLTFSSLLGRLSIATWERSFEMPLLDFDWPGECQFFFSFFFLFRCNRKSQQVSIFRNSSFKSVFERY